MKAEVDVEFPAVFGFDAAMLGDGELHHPDDAERFLVAAVAEAGDHLRVDDVALVVDRIPDRDRAFDAGLAGGVRVFQFFFDEGLDAVPAALEVGRLDEVLVLLLFLHGSMNRSGMGLAEGSMA
jgi:hypothetical protein